MTTKPSIACVNATTVAETTHAAHEFKIALRHRLLAIRTAFEPVIRADYDAAIAHHLATWLQLNSVTVLAVFWPIRGEPALENLYHQLHTSGVQLALPAMTGKNLPLEFVSWTPGEPMTIDHWKIATPLHKKLVRPSTLLIPAVGFNSQRYRLGYGGGFYDRTLALSPRPQTVAVAYAATCVEFVPEPHDIAMDSVITEVGPV
jgi:5-formyltetrahydrofolate cyclo-ligase